MVEYVTKEMYNEITTTANMLAILSIQRLNGLGLIRSPDTKFIIDNTINKNAQITELGKIFYSTGIEPDC